VSHGRSASLTPGAGSAPARPLHQRGPLDRLLADARMLARRSSAADFCSTRRHVPPTAESAARIGKEASPHRWTGLLVFVHSGRLTLDLRDARISREGGVWPAARRAPSAHPRGRRAPSRQAERLATARAAEAPIALTCGPPRDYGGQSYWAYP
jgi:hypothetical protein